jgi:hypothetical protein
MKKHTDNFFCFEKNLIIAFEPIIRKAHLYTFFITRETFLQVSWSELLQKLSKAIFPTSPIEGRIPRLRVFILD